MDHPRKLGLNNIYRELAEDPAFDHIRSHDPPKHLVPGRGSLHPQVILIGEAPGAAENLHRQPFCGPAGRVLDQMLEHVGLLRTEVFITNALKYRPTIGTMRVKNRTPTPAEINAARPYLMRELSVFGTIPAVLLGRTPLHMLRGVPTPMRLVSGREVECHDADRRLGVVYHPAVAVYEPAMLATLKRHMASVMQRLL